MNYPVKSIFLEDGQLEVSILEFSRTLAFACFQALMWLMIVTGLLFLALTLAQYLRAEPNASPAITLGSAIGSFGFAAFLYLLSKRISNAT